MTITITYDDTETLGRVRLALSGYHTLADYAVVERSLDQVNWSVIRGGAAVGLTAGAGSIDDYEFVPNTLNYYRATAWNDTGGHFVAAGTAASADNATLNSGNGLGLPAGLAEDDVMLLFAANRDFGASPNAPAGWDTIVSLANIKVFRRVATASESVPSVTFTGSGAGDTCQAQIAAWRFIEPDLAAAITDSFANQQNINIPATNPGVTGPLTAVSTGWKNDVCTSVTAVTGYTMIPVTSSSLGDDQMIVWATRNFEGSLPATQFPVLGGVNGAPSTRGDTLVFRGVPTNQETQSFTPVVTRYRIKSPTRPSLNMIIDPVQGSLEIERNSRAGVFNVLSRTLPVAVVDAYGSRRTTIGIDVYGNDEKTDIDRRLSTGGVYFLQPPDPNGAIPTMYFILDRVVCRMDTETFTESFTFDLAMIEVARPPSTVFGSTTTWADIIADFATWADLMAAEATWSDVVSRVSDSEVIVP